MAKVLMYTTRVCPYCQMAQRLLEKGGRNREGPCRRGAGASARDDRARPGANTVPQIFIDDLHIGGYRELAQLEVKGELDPLLGL